MNIRLPLGITWKDIDDELEKILKRTDPSITYRYMEDPDIRVPATYTSTDERIFKVLRNNAEEVIGKKPLLSMTAGATDCRFYRVKGIPSVLFGPQAHGVAAADEYITIDDLVTVTKVHTGTIIDYLCGQ